MTGGEAFGPLDAAVGRLDPSLRSGGQIYAGMSDTSKGPFQQLVSGINLVSSTPNLPPSQSRPQPQLPTDPAIPTPVPKPKPSQSCDGCRHRKIRCVWNVPLPDIPGATAGEIQEAIVQAGLKCARCTSLDLSCAFRYEVKKRGPPKGFVRKTKSVKREEDDTPSGSQSPRPPSRPRQSTSLSISTKSEPFPLPDQSKQTGAGEVSPTAFSDLVNGDPTEFGRGLGEPSSWDGVHRREDGLERGLEAWGMGQESSSSMGQEREADAGQEPVYDQYGRNSAGSSGTTDPARTTAEAGQYGGSRNSVGLAPDDPADRSATPSNLLLGLGSVSSLGMRIGSANVGGRNPNLELPPLVRWQDERSPLTGLGQHQMQSPLSHTAQVQAQSQAQMQVPTQQSSPASASGSRTSHMSGFTPSSGYPPTLPLVGNLPPTSYASGQAGPSKPSISMPPPWTNQDTQYPTSIEYIHNSAPSSTSGPSSSFGAREQVGQAQPPPSSINSDNAKVGQRSVIIPGVAEESRPGYGPNSAPTGGKQVYIRLRLEDLMTRADAERICELYIDFIWHLIPCLHIPSFRADFAIMRDRYDPAFLAFLLSVIGLTFVLVPRQWLPESVLRREDFRRTVTMVLQASEDLLDEASDNGPAILTLTCHYLNVQINHQLGRRNNLFKSLGQCFMYVTAMRLFEPGSYNGLDPVEREMRKRLYWLSFGMDKSKACLADEPMLLRTSEYGPIDLPELVEDTDADGSPIGYRSGDPTPPIIGFIHISRLFAIQEEVLALYRQQRHCLSRADVDGTLHLLSALLERCQTEMVGCVVELRLSPNHDRNQDVPGMDALYGFFQSPSSSIRGKSFLVAQANIYVTQQWIRYLILQCRLSLIQQLNMAYEPDPRYTNESLEVICQDLLHVLSSIPIECIATNGLPLIEKVRYIAAGLLNVDAGHASLEVSSTNQSILMDFLVLMSDIERKYAV